MTPEARNLGQKLGSKSSVPESIQLAICIGALVLFAAVWQLNLVSIPVLMASAVGGTVALLVIAHCIPALRSSITIYQHGLETVVQGKAAAFTYEELNSLAAKFTDHLVNHQYLRTRVKIEFFVDGRFKPYIYEFEFRRGQQSEQLVLLTLDKCSQAIERRLLAELERAGAVRWRDNVSLTAEGIMLTDSVNASRLIPYREISDWKMVCNDLKIWKADDALPCLMMGNDTPNFMPLFCLFQSLCKSIRNIEPSCELEPQLAARA